MYFLLPSAVSGTVSHTYVIYFLQVCVEVRRQLAGVGPLFLEIKLRPPSLAAGITLPAEPSFSFFL